LDFSKAAQNTSREESYLESNAPEIGKPKWIRNQPSNFCGALKFKTKWTSEASRKGESVWALDGELIPHLDGWPAVHRLASRPTLKSNGLPFPIVHMRSLPIQKPPLY